MKVPCCRSVNSYFAVSPGLDVRLRQAADAVHAVGEIDAVPVDRGRHGQAVRHVDAHPLAFHGLDHGAVHMAVIGPALGPQAGVKGVVHFLGDQMKDFDATDDLQRERGPFGTTTGL